MNPDPTFILFLRSLESGSATLVRWWEREDKNTDLSTHQLKINTVCILESPPPTPSRKVNDSQKSAVELEQKYNEKKKTFFCQIGSGRKRSILYFVKMYLPFRESRTFAYCENTYFTKYSTKYFRAFSLGKIGPVGK